MVLAPPKPWERSNQTNLSSSTSLPNDHPPITSSNQTCPISNSKMTGSTTATTTTTTTPELPPRPTNMINSTGSLIPNDGLSGLNSAYGANYAGASPYGSRFGGYGLNSGYGGYGGYSRMGGLGSYGSYSGYGGIGGMGGMAGGGYGGYMGGMGDPTSMYQSNPMDPNNGFQTNPSLTQTLTNSTQSTFQLLQSLVMTFSGFSQLLESTFMMTHSSFFTFIQLIDQFNFFKFSIGKILSLFDIIKWTKKAIGGRGTDEGQSWGDSFKSFDPRKDSKALNPHPNNTPKPSRKPIVIFFLTIFGIPYLMNKLIKAISKRQETQDSLKSQSSLVSIDPNQLTFVKSIHPYHSNQPEELNFNQSEIIAVISPVNQEEREKFGWWRGRLRNGKMGWFPKNYVEVISSSIVSSNQNQNQPSQKFQVILDEEADRAKQLNNPITPNY
ncbi:uncharacterized protein MELLADRAFT_118067 [Melampsora larici-populina 98AG31]|uniref:Peroxisomal membrane protein PEX13 n=1 Tax=Melampsora larici-populina (strain 98AG31 / pathotype 3-4-7) TaxID=747676 RepID=F4S4S9_MELLP|nr:uncharacterized protein MELLADRAFT_118067 [Melampsora larici-populina 98AG31]EGG00375.1 hypothetical protein MELLADRAFT_118067 [Melampsora larici-populina 98AG31]